jgi:four helix bundle protein
MTEHPMFTHERLIAYQRAIAFVAWTQTILELLPAKVSARDQLDRASTSIPLNLAEGNGKFSVKDRARFWQIAHGSAVECAAILDVIVARGLQRQEEILAGKRLLSEIVGLTLGLLNKLETRINDQVGEDEAVYSPSPSPSPSQSQSMNYID